MGVGGTLFKIHVTAKNKNKIIQNKTNLLTHRQKSLIFKVYEICGLGHSSPVEKLEMTPNNQLVSFTISTIKIWDCVTGMCLSTLEPLCFIRAIMVLPDCRLLISTQSGETAKNSFNLITLNAKTNQYQVLPNVDENQKVPALKIFSIFSHRSQEKTKNNSVINSFNLNESLQKFYAVPRPCYRHRIF